MCAQVAEAFIGTCLAYGTLGVLFHWLEVRRMRKAESIIRETRATLAEAIQAAYRLSAGAEARFVSRA